jgi:hypothetical protein
MGTPRDLVLAHRAKTAGANYSLRIILEARRAKLPLSLAFALVEQESHFMNVFGCDHGSILCHEDVTHDRVLQLVHHVINLHGVSNGVGLTQLTWIGFITAAERLGGAHRPKNQLRVGFELLAQLIDAHGTHGGLAAYNAGDPHSAKGIRYAREVLARQARWHDVLMG